MSPATKQQAHGTAICVSASPILELCQDPPRCRSAAVILNQKCEVLKIHESSLERNRACGTVISVNLEATCWAPPSMQPRDRHLCLNMIKAYCRHRTSIACFPCLVYSPRQAGAALSVNDVTAETTTQTVYTMCCGSASSTPTCIEGDLHARLGF